MDIKPVVLEGTYVRLEPLTLDHIPGLCEVGLDPDLWQWTPFLYRTPSDMRNYVQIALRAQEQGTALPFATVERSSGRVIGSTRFGSIDREQLGIEIGWTWIAQQCQKTPINTEAKYLMLKHAFETFGCIRVQFKTDSLNTRSRAALLRIGAREEGVFRNHMITYSGRIRHTVYFSIIDSEWPQVKAHLEEQLQRPFEQRA
jgi:RimJ/RimL family protein N-acetyltransferase